MTAAERIAQTDQLPATELCRRTGDTLETLVRVMNEETTLLRAGRYREASILGAEKARVAQDYVGLVRAVQRQSQRLLREAPVETLALRDGHERLATQMAENLRVIATARSVTESLLSDVATGVSQQQRPRTYGNSGTVAAPPIGAAGGIAINRAL